MRSTYRAMQVSRPGVLELVERRVEPPAADEVLLEVEACGICGADAGLIEGSERGVQLPRVPGHEVVGRIVATGAQTPSIWRVGQRVGVGRLGGHCQVCRPCRLGQFHLCQNQPSVGSSRDGGYAEMMLARSTGLVAIPDELESEAAAPLLCAGLATFNALKKSGVQPGDTVAILGVGGLGHLAIQYARRMGLRVVAIGRGAGTDADAMTLGAHLYLDTTRDDVVAQLQRLGGAQLLLSTITDSTAVSALAAALAPQGTLLLLGVGQEPVSVMPGLLVGGDRLVRGSLTGSPIESEKTLDFSMLVDVRPWIEVFALEQAQQAYARMRSGQARYRMVLQMPGGSAA